MQTRKEVAPTRALPLNTISTNKIVRHFTPKPFRLAPCSCLTIAHLLPTSSRAIKGTTWKTRKQSRRPQVGQGTVLNPIVMDWNRLELQAFPMNKTHKWSLDRAMGGSGPPRHKMKVNKMPLKDKIQTVQMVEESISSQVRWIINTIWLSRFRSQEQALLWVMVRQEMTNRTIHLHLEVVEQLGHL